MTSKPHVRRGRLRGTVVSDAVCLGMAVGFYLWILSGPRPADVAVFQTTQMNLLAGLPILLLVGQLAAFLLVAGFTASRLTRAWSSTLALASCGLYLAALGDASGPWTILLAPACALGWLIGLTTRSEETHGGAVLLTLHAGTFGAAIAFYHQWPRYRLGWEPFLDSLNALKKLWLNS